ncbi:MAG: MBL fold metallo-hydrolase [Treponema sp.]|nr:MBL fold metallo-hydrolase [Treponema sp.]
MIDQDNPTGRIIQLTDKIQWRPASQNPFCCDIIFIKSSDEKGDFTWVFDVGVGSAAANAVNAIQGRKKIIISHFHPDHILNLPFVKYEELYVTKYTKRYTRAGTLLSEPTDFGDIKVLPMPSSHAKGCLALVCGPYAFLGDGAFCKYRGLHHLYNPQILYEMIKFMEGIDCKYYCLDHEKNFIQDREPVLALYRDIYARRKGPDGKDVKWINVDDYFPLETS